MKSKPLFPIFSKGRTENGTRQSAKRQTGVVRFARRRGKQCIWRRRGYARRAFVRTYGVYGKAGARHGDFGDFARVALFVFVIFFAWFVRFFRACAHGNRRDGRRSVGGGIFGQIAHKNGQFTLCGVAGGGGGVFVFRVKFSLDGINVYRRGGATYRLLNWGAYNAGFHPYFSRNAM